MATLVDLPEDNEEDNREFLEAEEDLQDVEAQPVEDNPAEPEEDDLPEKYRGKSAADLAKMHANLEELMGRQSQEVGELRQAFDEMVKSSILQKQQPAPEPEAAEEVDFWSDPEGSIKRAIQNDPSIRQAQQLTAEMAKRQSLEALKSTHPDMKEILTDTKFQDWVGKSKIRQQLFAQADQNYDFEAANELFSLWKERAQVAKQAEAMDKQSRKQEVKQASTGSARSNPEGRQTKKIYRRRDIIELMNRDPKRYEALQPEIMKAYAEGRVK